MALVCSKLDYGCFIYGVACKLIILCLIQSGFEVSLGPFTTSPAQSPCVEANELPFHLRRQKLVLQFTIKIAPNPNNAVYETIFNPQYVDHFSLKPFQLLVFVLKALWRN